MTSWGLKKPARVCPARTEAPVSSTSSRSTVPGTRTVTSWRWRSSTRTMPVAGRASPSGARVTGAVATPSAARRASSTRTTPARTASPATGVRSMPQMGQAPASASWMVGCMGRVQWGPAAGAGAASGAAAAQSSGPPQASRMGP